jgi:phosphatidylinositol glycan class B
MTRQQVFGFPERDGTFKLIVVAVLLVACIPRFWAAWVDQGIFWPDEIFQGPEQAHRAVFGFGIVPWEFRSGARSWVFPGLIAAILKLGALIGLTSGQSLVLLLKTSMALISLVGLYLTMRLAFQLAGPRAALLGGIFAAFFPMSLLLASRAYSEMVSIPLVLGSVILSRDSGKKRQLLSGSLAGLAICIRYQNGLFACALLAILASERRFKDASWFALGTASVAVLGGLLDWATWGRPFGAFRKYLFFNLKKSGDKFGRYPFYYYATVAWTAVGPTILLIVAGLLLSARLAPKLFLIVVGYILLHSAIPHKEFRFIMPVVPLGLALSAVGIVSALRNARMASSIVMTLGVLSAAAMCLHTTQLTWAKLGFPSDRGDRSPWHSGEGINRLLWEAGTRTDNCGLMVTGESFGWVGGYTYLHRDVNLFAGTSEAEQSAANYLIAPQSSAPLREYRMVASSREFSLLKRPGTCGPPPPDYRRELPY